MSPLQSIYDYHFYKDLICPQGTTYKPFPESFKGGFVFVTDLNSEVFNYNEQNYYLQILIVGVKENDERKGGTGCSQITLTVKKAIITSNFQIK